MSRCGTIYVGLWRTTLVFYEASESFFFFFFPLQINLLTFLQQFQLIFLTRWQSDCIQNYSVQWSLLCRPGGILHWVGCDGDGALVDLHVQADPVSSSHLQGLLQHRRRLLPVRVVAQGADAVFRVQVDVVPERDRRDSPCMCGLDLEEREISLLFLWSYINF